MLLTASNNWEIVQSLEPIESMATFMVPQSAPVQPAPVQPAPNPVINRSNSYRGNPSIYAEPHDMYDWGPNAAQC